MQGYTYPLPAVCVWGPLASSMCLGTPCQQYVFGGCWAVALRHVKLSASNDGSVVVAAISTGWQLLSPL